MKQKGHHFITESYQRNFTDSNGHVWVLTNGKKIFNSNPKNTFKEDHFYTVKLPGGGTLAVEKTLAEIEGAFISVVNNKILKREELNEEDRAYVSLFVAAMLTRTKVQRNHFRDTFNNLIKRMEDMQAAMRKNPPKAPPMERGDGPSFSLDELKQHMRDFDSEESLSTLALLRDTAPAIGAMKWSILIAPEGTAFVSSDNPFCMCSPERERLYGRRAIGASAGLADGDVEVTFPLTKGHALFAEWENSLPPYVEATPETVEQINRRTSRTAHNLIASSKQELEEIIKRAEKHEEAK